MNDPVLVIGNKNYSSWSLRPWLFLRKNNLPFVERKIWLYEPEFKLSIAEYDSGGKVPVLIDGGNEVWDSMAIIETVIDRYKVVYGWPKAPDLRAHARAASCEMHSSFMALRAECPMDIRSSRSVSLSAAAEADIERVCHLWTRALQLSGLQGRWLYGDFSAADAMFAPVVFRFKSHGIKVSPLLRDYMDYVLADEALSEWVSDARREQRSFQP